ncbi:hypothetical protein Celaphus_00005535, partial [Cervus elaphus hippelaphus]
ITAFSDKANEFHNVESLQCQVDSYFSHLAQINTLRKNCGLGHMNIMLLSDMTKQTSRDLGPVLALRGLFIIDPNGVIKPLSVNDLPVGPSMGETLSLKRQHTVSESVLSLASTPPSPEWLWFPRAREITAFSDKANEFHNVESLQCQVDSYFSHLAQINTLRKNCGLGHMNIMLLSDMTKQTSRDLGPVLALRGLFIIDPNGVIKPLSVNDLPVGPSMGETLSLVKAFQFVESH